MRKGLVPTLLLLAGLLMACAEDEEQSKATVSIQNDFNNPEIERKPPWTICEANYGGTEFGNIIIGETSTAKEVNAGLDYVLMVLAWDDPSCAPENCLPVASKNQEETVSGQTRVIAINAPNHQGPCPPEGVQPIPQELYERILALYPKYGFKPYEQRTENPQCLD